MNREAAWARLGTDPLWDVLIIGGGATGLGCAVEATARGYRTLLVEQADFAQGTSSRSTKLIHGGVRYLAQGNVGLVREALRERARLLANAPGLVHAVPLVIPLQSRWERFYLGTGLRLYDLLAQGRRLGATQHLGDAEMAARLPGFAGPAPQGGWLFYDGQFDDARLAIALARTAVAKGAAVLNHAPVRSFLREQGRIIGAVVEDAESGHRIPVRARVIINATGVFADEVRRLDEPQGPAAIVPSQGIHLVLPRHFLRGETGILIPKTADGRVLFALPWHDRVLLGTTDTPVSQPRLEPRAQPEEVAFLLDHARRFLGWEIAPREVLSVFAGLRPLVKARPGAATSKLARDHVISVSPAGLVTVTGGKWTTYRLMGEQTVDAAARAAGLAARPSATAELPLEVREPGAELSLAEIATRAATEEMARTVEDVLSRRTRALLLDARGAMAAAPEVAAALAAALGRPPEWAAAEVERFNLLAPAYLVE